MGRDIGMAAGKRGGGALEVSRKVACKRHAGSTGCPRRAPWGHYEREMTREGRDE